MVEKIKFSIICPVYNSEKTIVNSINSVLKQRYTNWELIIVDDGSNDESGKICDSFALENNKIKVFHKINEGQGLARLFGISKAKGDYVLFLDSDDCFAENTFSLIASFIKKSKVDLILFNAIKIYKNKRELLYDFNSTASVITSDCVHEYFLKRIAGYSCSSCFKRSMLNDVQCYLKTYSTLSYCEDLYLIFNLVNLCNPKMGIIPSVLYEYYVQNESITKNVDFSRSANRFFVFNYIYDTLFKQNNKIFKNINKTVFSTIGWAWLSYLMHGADEQNYALFRGTCKIIKQSLIYNKVKRFKKDKISNLITFLFSLRAFRLIFFILKHKIS